MLLFRNGRFHVFNASFVLPGDCYLETHKADTKLDKGVEIVDAERKYRILFRGLNNEERRVDFFQFHCEAEPSRLLLRPIYPIKHNELAGYNVYYESARHFHCEYLFDLADTDEVKGHVHIFMQKTTEIFLMWFKAEWCRHCF